MKQRSASAVSSVQSQAGPAPPDLPGRAEFEERGEKVISGHRVVGTRMLLPNPRGLKLGAVTLEAWRSPELLIPDGYTTRVE